MRPGEPGVPLPTSNDVPRVLKASIAGTYSLYRLSSCSTLCQRSATQQQYFHRHCTYESSVPDALTVSE
eukprot:401768-Rhodomonas_salina.4